MPACLLPPANPALCHATCAALNLSSSSSSSTLLHTLAVQVVASDFVLPASLQVRAADDSSSGSGAAAFPGASTYRVALPGGLAGRCLRQSGSGGSSDSSSGSTAVSLMAVQTEEQQGDAIYCGPLKDAAAALPPAPQVEASSGGGIGASSSGTGASSVGGSVTSQQEVAPPVTQVNEVRSGAERSGLPCLVALLLATCLAAALTVA